MHDLSLKNNQQILGVLNGSTKPVLRKPLGRLVGYIINTQASDFTIKRLEIQDTAQMALVRIQNSGAFSITENNFTPLSGYTSALHLVCGEPSVPGTGIGSLTGNHFNLESASTGLVFDCRNTGLQVELSNNHYHLGAEAYGINIFVGGVSIKGDRFVQVEEVPSTDIPVGVMFRPNDLYSGFETDYGNEPARAFLNTEITCSNFDGGSYGQLIPLSLSHLTASNSREHNQVRLAFNTFNNVPRVLEDEDSGYAVFSTNSVCNVWQHEDSTVDRCDGITTTGFLHFTDNVNCGQAPADFQAPDCTAERETTCGGVNTMPSPAATPLITPESTTAPLTPQSTPTPVPPADWDDIKSQFETTCMRACQQDHLANIGATAMPDALNNIRSNCQNRCMKTFAGFLKIFNNRRDSFYEPGQ